MTSILNPEIPYYGRIPGGLRPGLLVSIVGKILASPRSFYVNFVVGDSLNAYTLSQSDVAFHFNPRFNEHCVVRNARRGGKWEDEERLPARFLPFYPGGNFEILILIETNSYKVAVDGQHQFEFKHRLPLSMANILEIGGDVAIRRIDFKPGMGNNNGPANAFRDCLVNLYNPSVPVNHPLSGLPTNTMIYVSGRPNFFFSRFSINLHRTVGSSTPDTVFHFDVRRSFGQSYNIVVRNARVNGEWGKEERIAPGFPFASGVNFDLMIRVESSRFTVAVNGQHFTDFPHRTEYQNANLFAIEGDVTISSIRIN